VRLSQIERLKKLRAERNEEEVQSALAAITKEAETGKGNLLELAIDAAKKRASLGEISDACEKVAGRYKAVIRTIEGVYKSEAKDKSEFKEAQELAQNLPKCRAASRALW
jgi:methylmalonyl-CoA mutase